MHFIHICQKIVGIFLDKDIIQLNFQVEFIDLKEYTLTILPDFGVSELAGLLTNELLSDKRNENCDQGAPARRRINVNRTLEKLNAG